MRLAVCATAGAFNREYLGINFSPSPDDIKFVIVPNDMNAANFVYRSPEGGPTAEPEMTAKVARGVRADETFDNTLSVRLWYQSMVQGDRFETKFLLTSDQFVPESV